MTDLASHYSRFRVTERILLTGHSHQAWPDVSFEAQQQAWLDAAVHVDDKWNRAAEAADDVCAGWRRLLADPEASIALGQNTHELVTRVLSAVLDPAATSGSIPRRTLVTTDGEFHTIRRQLDRLEEAGVAVARVRARPVTTLAERLAALVDDTVACVLVSSVLYETAETVPHLAHLAEACLRHNAALLVDAYHHLNVVPFDVTALGLRSAYVIGGGYKYCQLGEGNCFLRLPDGCTARPVLTGWFSEFGELAAARTPGEVRYGHGGARFAGSTYDPTAHYRARAVFRFHVSMGLTPARLREINLHQTSTLIAALQSHDLNPAVAAVVEVPADRRAGFIAIRTPQAQRLVTELRTRGVYVDARGTLLRLGPAPYVSDRQLDDAVGQLVAALGG